MHLTHDDWPTVFGYDALDGYESGYLTSCSHAFNRYYRKMKAERAG